MSRGWTWINDEGPDEAAAEKSTPFLDQLARQWSDLYNAGERRGFARLADMEDGYGPDFDEAEEFAFVQMERLQDARHQAELNTIADALYEHGARMMRPYEHWNEDEAYMAYAEREW